MEAEATPLASSVTMIGRTLRAASCSQSGIEASFETDKCRVDFLAARPDQGAGGFDDVERGSGGQETLAQFAGAGKVNDEDGSAGKV